MYIPPVAFLVGAVVAAFCGQVAAMVLLLFLAYTTGPGDPDK